MTHYMYNCDAFVKRINVIASQIRSLQAQSLTGHQDGHYSVSREPVITATRHSWVLIQLACQDGPSEGAVDGSAS